MIPKSVMEINISFAKARNIYYSFCQPVCKKYNINNSCFNVLIFLANNPDHNTARDFCTTFSAKTGMVSVTVENLIQQGLLAREYDKSDRRIKRLVPTEKAIPIIDDGRKMQKRFFDTLSNGLSKEEIYTFYNIFEKILRNIDNTNKEMLKEND